MNSIFFYQKTVVDVKVVMADFGADMVFQDKPPSLGKKIDQFSKKDQATGPGGLGNSHHLLKHNYASVSTTMTSESLMM